MARLARSLTVTPNFPIHKMWRGHNRENNLGTDTLKKKYLDYLNDDFESKKHEVGCDLNALCLMSNHGHEMFRILNPEAFSGHMRRHHSRYGMYFNKMHSRSGKVAEDRPRTCQIKDDEHEMRAVFYIHANPIRANMVKDARNYRWSTHNLYAFGKREAWARNITLPHWYLRLGQTMAQRQRRYRQLFYQYLRDYGTLRLNFNRRLFFGPAIWVEQKQQLVKKWRREHSPP